MTPDSAMQLQKLGYDCAIEAGAGAAAGFSDAAYEEAGVEIVKTAAALWKTVDIIAKVRQPNETELKRLAKGKTLISFFNPGGNEEGLELAKSKGAVTSAIPEVLFVCVQNAGRSQMAAAIAAERSGGRLLVRSAGSMPAAALNPAVVSSMAEIGLDLTEEFPKPLTDDVVRAADVVVTMGCGDACPIYPGKHYEDWQLDDPEHASVDDVRRVRDEITAHVDRMLLQLDIASV